MRHSKFKKKGIFCIEGDWNHNLKDKTSVKHTLEFLKHSAKIENIYKNCSTEAQFEEYIKTSLQRGYKEYSIIYIAFHGASGSIDLGKRTKLGIDKIAKIINTNGDATDKIIHFGCCSTLDIPTYKLRRFLKETGAIAISGYTEKIDFVQSMCLDILYFNHCQEFLKISAIENKMNKYYKGLIKELGFKIKYL